MSALGIALSRKGLGEVILQTQEPAKQEDTTNRLTRRHWFACFVVSLQESYSYPRVLFPTRISVA